MLTILRYTIAKIKHLFFNQGTALATVVASFAECFEFYIDAMNQSIEQKFPKKKMKPLHIIIRLNLK